MARTQRVARALKAYPPAYRVARRARLAVGRTLPPRQIAGVPGRVHRNDLMLEGLTPDCVDAYKHAGQEAVALMAEALAASGRTFGDLDGVLDFGCGHGRVVRWLVRQIDPGRVTACDLDPEAVAFCASEFGVRRLVSREDFGSVEFGAYDLVWAGSLATHLPETAWLDWVQLMPKLLRTGGAVVFTTHEPALVANSKYAPDLERQAGRLQQELTATGFAYLPYTHYGHDRYGVSFHAPDRVEADMGDAGLTRLLFRSRGWGGHQDVHAFALK